MKKFFAILIATVMLLGLFACAAKSSPANDGKYTNAYESSYAGKSDGFSYDADYAVMPEEAPVPNPTNTSSQSATNRKIIKTGSLTVEAVEYDQCIDSINKLISDAGGYVEASKESKYRAGQRYSDITVRIPQENFDSFMNGVLAVGNVTGKSINANDVTESYVDVQSRLNVLKEEKASLMKIMESAETVEDLMYVQNRLYDVIEEIESYEARLRTYDSQIDYSEITITVEEVEKETPVEEETWGQEFKRRVKESLENFWEFLKGFGIGIVVVLPWLIIPAVIAIVVIVIVRTAIKRRRKKAAIAIQAANAMVDAEKHADQ